MGAGAIALLTSKRTWVIAAIAALVALAAFMVGSYVQTKSENVILNQKIEKVEKERDQLAANNKANVKAIETRNELVDALAKVETVERVKTVKALQANPDWAKQPIPADVLASLRR